jgi:predicted Zn-dependent protease
MSRIDAIRKIVESQPNDPFPRYGLAMELRNAERLDEAHAEFEELARRHPDYVPQYLMHVQLLARMSRKDAARAVAEQGLAAARSKGDMHALNEIQAALEGLDAEDDD